MKKTFLAVFFVVCLCCVELHADIKTEGSKLSVDSMQFLENVVVYAKKPYQEVIPAQTLSGTRLQGLNSHSIADAIRYFSGVQIKDYGGVGGVKTIDIRSMGTNHLAVFYDGIQLGNAQNGQIDLGKYSLDNIDEISLYNGQKSEIFQPARDFGSAGSVYIRSHRPRFSNGKTDNFNATMRTGSFGLVNPSLRWEHRFGARLSGVLNAEYTYATGQYHFRYRKRFSDGTPAWDTTAVRKNGDLNALRLEGSVFGAVTDGSWHAKVYFYDSERGIPGAIVNNVWLNSQRQWDRNFFAQGRYTQRLSATYELMVNAKYARDFMHYVNPDTTLMLIDNKFWQDEFYVSVAHKLAFSPNFETSVAVDYKWNKLDATLDNFAHPKRNTLLTSLAAAYTLGRLKAQGSLLYTLVAERAKLKATKTWNKFTPALFLSFQPFENSDFNLRAFYKRIFRMPTFNDLYYTDIGNAQLRPEWAHQLNAGAQWQTIKMHGFFRGAKLTADVYYNRITDKIIAVPAGRGQYRWMMMNIGKVKIRGVDATARTSLAFPAEVLVDVSLAYTYQTAQDYTDPTDAGDGGTYKGQIAYIPWHSGSATVNASWRDFSLNYSFIYVGERYHNSSNIPANHEQPWYTHDISANYVLKIGAHARLKLTAEVNNLFNQQYDVILNYPMPGRNYKFVVKYDF